MATERPNYQDGERRGGRILSDEEVSEMLALDIPARLATIDPDGFPRITPIWFLWEAGAFYMTSYPFRPHLRNLVRNPHAAICIDVEEHAAVGGVRPNRQVKGQGTAETFPDQDGYWTSRITLKYIQGPDAELRAEQRASKPRIVIRLVPRKLVRIGT